MISSQLYNTPEINPKLICSERRIYCENDMINIIAGLSMPMHSFPNTLYAYGYKIISIEKSYKTTRNQEVKFDIVLNSYKYNSTIAWECKGGNNTDAPQLEKYASLSKEELIVNLPIPCSDIINHNMDIGILCNSERYERIKLGIINRYEFPITTIDKNLNKIELKYNNFKVKELNNLLRNLDIPSELPQIIRFTKDSKEHEIATTLLPTFVSLALQGRNSISLDELTNMINTPIKGISEKIGTDLIKSINRKTKLVIIKAASCELKKYIVWDGRTKILSIKTLNPNLLNGFTKKSNLFIDRLKNGLYYKEIEGQLFLDGLDEIE